MCMQSNHTPSGRRALVGHRRTRSLVRRAVMAGLVAVIAGVLAPAGFSAGVIHPSVSTDGISNLTSSSVTLHGYLNAHGQPTNYVFQYGATKGYSAETPLASAGNATRTIFLSQAVSGLQAHTTYHYRILATSATGAVAGAAHSFTTPKIPLSLQLAATPNPVLFGDPFTVQGTLSGTDAFGRAVALQLNPFPYLGGFKTFGNFEVIGSSGSFSFPVVGMLANTQVRVVTTSAPFISSPVVVEGVAVRVSFSVRRVHRRRRGLFVRMSGTVTPAEVGARVGFQLLRPGASSTNQGGTFVTPDTSTVSHFSTVVRIRHRGLYEALVQVSDGSHVSAYSPPIRIR
jgi:hypothetical protein